MKTELKPYQLGRRLGSGVKIQGQSHGQIEELSHVSDNSVNITGRGTTYGMWADIFNVKLVLRPLSHLTIPITHNGETFVPNHRHPFKLFVEADLDYFILGMPHSLNYERLQWLIEHRFHIDEPEGTWISVDELNTNPYEN